MYMSTCAGSTDCAVGEMATDQCNSESADFKSKDYMGVSTYLCEAGVSLDICQVFEGKLV